MKDNFTNATVTNVYPRFGQASGTFNIKKKKNHIGIFFVFLFFIAGLIIITLY